MADHNIDPEMPHGNRSPLIAEVPSFDDHGNFGELRCPNCDTEYLHHAGAVVFDRAEDEKMVLRTEILPGGDVVSGYVPNSADNPSDRRTGIVIRFWCELCSSGDASSPQLELTISQHKGHTQVTWRRRAQ